MTDRTKTNLVILTIVGLVACQIGVLAFLYPRFSFIGTDGALYATIAENIAHGRGFTLYGIPHTVFSPFLPYAAAAFIRLGAQADLGSHLATMVFGLLTVPAMYYLFSRFGRQAGLIAATLTAANGPLIWSAMLTPNPQVIIAFLSVTVWLVLWRALTEPDNRWAWPVLGALLSLSYLARPEYVLLFPIAAVTLLVSGFRSLRGHRIWISLAGLILAFLVLAGPYLLFLKNELGRWAISGRENEAVLIITSDNYESVDSADGSMGTAVVRPPRVNDGVSRLSDNLPALAKRFFKGLRDNERTFAKSFGVLGLLLAGFGISHVIRQRQWYFALSGIFVLIPVLAIALVIEGGKTDYLTQFFPVFIGMIALGIMQLSADLALRFRWSTLVPFVITAALVPYFFFTVVQGWLFLPKDYRPEEQKMLGLWMKSNLPDVAGAQIISRKPDVAFYAGGQFALVPDGIDVLGLASAMRELGARYLVADSRFLKPARPLLSSLVDMPKSSGNFDLLHSEEYRGQKAFLYRLK